MTYHHKLLVEVYGHETGTNMHAHSNNWMQVRSGKSRLSITKCTITKKIKAETLLL
jgi:hypothetical protein